MMTVSRRQTYVQGDMMCLCLILKTKEIVKMGVETQTIV